MKKIFYLLCVILAFMSCEKLDITPDNIQKSEDFTIKSSPARTYEIRQTGDSLYVFSTEAGLLYYHYKTDIIGESVDINSAYYNDNQVRKGIVHGQEKWNDIKKITIEGVTNAMDYACIKNNFECVEYIDLSNTTIEYYKGRIGTLDFGEMIEYKENEIPPFAFYYGSCWCKWESLENTDKLYWGHLHLKDIKLPNSITSINHCAFCGVVNLKEIVIPEGVVDITTMEDYSGNAFSRCWGLEKVYLPSTLKSINEGTFINCYAIKEVHIAAQNPPKEVSVKYEEHMTFGKAVDGWNLLDSDWGFGAGIGVGGDSWTAFDGHYIPKTNATLYVPKGCKDNYKDWERYFQNIVEEE